MEKYRIGVLGTADIAYRRMIPAITHSKGLEHYGVAIPLESERILAVSSLGGFSTNREKAVNPEKKKRAEEFVSTFGGTVVEGYEAMLQDEKVDAVYLPLPPSLHEYWAKLALEYGKHVFVEKPCTISRAGTKKLLELAEEKDLALYENYAFCLHDQVDHIKKAIASGRLGDLRLIRASFGFPYRGAGDFRYQKSLGGGALFDCGGYTLKAAQLLLGEELKVIAASLHTDSRHDVDLFGTVTVQNQEGLCAQLSFGMDNVYQCSLEVIGSAACLTAPRIFSPPADFEPQLSVRSQTEEVILVPAGDQFLKAAEDFAVSIGNSGRRQEVWGEVKRQSELVQEVIRVAGFSSRI